jgi:outer membrane protein TolC
MNIRFRFFLAAWTLVLDAGAADAQPPPPPRQQPAPAAGRSLELAALQQAAIDTDPRSREVQLLASQSDLRLRNIAAGRLPSVGVEGQAQYQSDVPRAPFTLPNGQPLFSPPRATYDGYFRVDQRLFDAVLGAQSQLERAQLAEQQVRVRTTLFSLRQQVSDGFFAAAALQERAGALASTIDDLETRLRETEARVREGAALAAESAAVEATLLQRRQDAAQIGADRRAALARLARLTGQAIGEGETLVLPDLVDAVARARAAPDAARARPEYAQFARTRDRIARQQDVAAAQEQPRVSAFGRVGYGKPGLNFISDQFESYGLGGIRIQWNAWTWGAADRERRALAIQQEVVSADEQAFTRSLGEANEADLETIDRLREVLTLDDRIVMLREQVERSTQVRFQEGVVTASDYLDRVSDLLQARFARAGHQVELAQASARLLTTLGLEVR